MSYFTTITSKGQITLPAEVRRKLHISAGQRLKISLRDNEVVVEPPEDLMVVREQTQAYLKSKGFTSKKLRQMAEDYQNGDGMTAYVKEKYGPSKH